MENATTQANATPVKDVYSLVTEKIIEQLGKGIVPWQQQWTDSGLPKNLVTGKPYRGLNLILLASQGYFQNDFLSFKQVQELGGKVKKDEKGHMVIYWKLSDKSAGKQAEDEEAAELAETDTGNKRLLLRYYTVFNVSQCEGLPEKLIQEARVPVTQPYCEHIIKGMLNAPKIQFKEAKAYYNPLLDIINMPKQKSFRSDDAYYSVLFHELVHSTGHHSRLERKELIQMSEFGSDAYSLEELVAEIGTCYLQSLTGIESQFQQSAAYIQGWLAKLKHDKRFIFTAASAAQKAVDHILNVQSDTEEPKVL